MIVIKRKKKKETFHQKKPIIVIVILDLKYPNEMKEGKRIILHIWFSSFGLKTFSIFNLMAIYTYRSMYGLLLIL